jgi:uracil-DNA glycosylase
MTAKEFVDSLADLHMQAVFNPYSERCAKHDCPEAPAYRRSNLEAFIEAAIHKGVDTVWIARDLGYRGGRRTGVPLTDEVHLDSMARLFGGLTVKRATIGPVVAERTAAVIWDVINQIDRPVFLWNIFPLHPHEPGDPMSNRRHTRTEREMCRPLLVALLNMLEPRHVVAIGRDAHLALATLGIDSIGVRHPSYGGQNEFKTGVFHFYGVNRPSAPEKAIPGSVPHEIR